MEWPEIFAKHDVTQRDAGDFYVQTENQVHIHNLKLAFRADKDGNFRMQQIIGMGIGLRWSASAVRQEQRSAQMARSCTSARSYS